MYLEVPMHDAALVQVADGLQNLLDHRAGVLLRVHASVQDPVEKLPAGNPESRNRGLVLLLDDPSETEKVEHSQLHDEVEVGATLVELLHPHHVLVLDPVETNKRLLCDFSLRLSEEEHKERNLLSTAISFSRFRFSFCFFFTHFMANIFPVFFSFTM